MNAPWKPDDDEIDRLARVGAPDLAAAGAEDLRTRLLAAQRDVPQLSRRSITPWIAGGTLAIAAAATIALWLGRNREPEPVARAPKQLIESVGAARFESINEWPDFVIRLDDGGVSITVASLEPTERFRVKTADAEVEVRGTQFVVQADNGRIVSVAVQRGWVELRRPGEPVIELRDGEHWNRVLTARAGSESGATTPDVANLGPTKVDPAVANPAPTRTGSPSSNKISTGRPSTLPERTGPDASKPTEATKREPIKPKRTKPEPVKLEPEPTKPVAAISPAGLGEADFRAGWAALRGSKVVEAAKLFVASCGAASGAIAEDACFWAAAASKRAGQSATRGLLEQFLRRFPRSGRAGEAAALLGWTLYDAGDLAGAETQFRRSANDRVPQVRDSAQRGLTAIERRRAKP